MRAAVQVLDQRTEILCMLHPVPASIASVWVAGPANGSDHDSDTAAAAADTMRSQVRNMTHCDLRIVRCCR